VEHGEAEAARPLLDEALQLFEQNGASEHTSETHRFAAEVWLALGQAEEARRSAHRALELASAGENADHLGHAWRVLGLVCDATGVADQRGDEELDAEACLRRAVHCFAPAEMPRDRAVALFALAEVVARRSVDAGAALRDEATELLAGLDLASPADRQPATSG
jgi:tetratricopeptide (TPR) repeat protein